MIWAIHFSCMCTPKGTVKWKGDDLIEFSGFGEEGRQRPYVTSSAILDLINIYFDNSMTIIY